MLLLTSVNDKLQIVSASAITVDVHASWVDNNAGTITPGRTNTAISTAATIDIVAAPAASTQRNVQTINIRNKHATSSNLITVQHTDGTTVIELLKYTLLAGEVIQYLDGVGFRIYDVNGAAKEGAAAGRFLKTTVLTSGTSFTTLPGTTQLFVRIQAAGGGGGGLAANAAGNGNAGGGGAGGGYAEKTFTVVGNTAYTYAIGGAGSAGASGGGTGGTGGNSTFAVGATTVTAFGGLGGTFLATGTVQNYALGGAPGAISTNGDVNSSGVPGRSGVIIAAGVVGVGGGGGSSAFGAGGPERKTTGAGTAAIGFGSGGSGALSLASGAAQAGGAGTAGVIIVDEYS